MRAKRKYIVTQDVCTLMDRWCKASGRARLGQRVYDRLFCGLVAELQRPRSLEDPDVVVEGWRVSDVKSAIRYVSQRLPRSRRKADRCYRITFDDLHLQTRLPGQGDPSRQGAPATLIAVTRLVDINTHPIGRGPRPHQLRVRDMLDDPQPLLPLEEQIDRCANEMEEHGMERVALIDDGLFSGETVKTVWELLLDRDEPKQITEIAVGLARCEALRALELWRLGMAWEEAEQQARHEAAAGTVCTPASAEARERAATGKLRQSEPVTYRIAALVGTGGVRDWICERDFYYGVPRSGKLVGTRVRGEQPKPIMPPVCVPYLGPYGKPDSWASLVSEEEFKAFAVRSSLTLWRLLAGDGPVTLGDLPAVLRDRLETCPSPTEMASKARRLLDQDWLGVLQQMSP